MGLGSFSDDDVVRVENDRTLLDAATDEPLKLLAAKPSRRKRPRGRRVGVDRKREEEEKEREKTAVIRVLGVRESSCIAILDYSTRLPIQDPKKTERDESNERANK